MRKRAGSRMSVLAIAFLGACGEKPAPRAVAPASVAAPTVEPPPPSAPPSVPAAPRDDGRLRALLENCRDQCMKAFAMPDADETAILERLKTIDTNPDADDAEWTRFSGVVARVRARDERLRTDPRFAFAEKKRQWLRQAQNLSGVEMTWVFADPYVIFQQVKQMDVRDTKRVVDATGANVETPVDGTSNPAKVAQNAAWAQKGELFARREAILLVELHRRFRELFAERFKLPELSSTSRVLTALVLWNRAGFDKLCADTGEPASPSTRAFYSPVHQRLVTYIGDESLQQTDEIPCAGGRVQKSSDRSLCWVGTQQLLHEYGAIHRGAPLVDGAVQPPADRAYWFTTGLAEFMSAVEVDEAHLESLDGAMWSHERVPLETIATARNAREVAEKWTIAQLMRAKDRADVASTADSLAPGQAPSMQNAFACRAWAFCHFLWNYDEGRYRSRFLDFLELVLAGTESSEKFATDIMKRPTADDWGEVEMEFEWYWRELMKRQVRRSAKTGQWSTSSTDPPAGRAEDDTEFVEAWNLDHKPSAAPSKR